jgi:uncharacterized protein with HEPN domain
MSQRETKALLTDAVEAISFLVERTTGLTRASYLADPVLRAAVERKFEVLVEALNRLGRTEPAVFESIPDAHRAVALRNLIAHGYDRVDHIVLWDTIVNDLPKLLAAVQSAL